ncbi:MAG: protein phosphatase CheZ [Aquabacterium sp.]|uniref:protein phosphatase CheZ n=1 Tax=Aquabacterium sp. TaxID=1872578 RepID=UPI0025B8053D|nr:protein phosphatase CheZ [Aquabacterium sp.]MBI5925420.1 protein phosphatase CheZ [Aquabacterium sp.]
MKMDLPDNMQMPAASPEIFQQLGTLTRQLHDTLNMLGVLPDLKYTVEDLPDARSRLTYIATKTADAAEKVLDLVDKAKADQEHIASETRRLAQLIVADPVKAVASGAVMNFVQDVETTTHRVDGHLTDIMMAQDFHDLTGQVVAKVVKLANDLESQLVKLLVQAAPPEQAQKVEATLTAHGHGHPTVTPTVDGVILEGPVVDAAGRSDVVTNQGEVDDLLASLGF